MQIDFYKCREKITASLNGFYISKNGCLGFLSVFLVF